MRPRRLVASSFGATSSMNVVRTASGLVPSGNHTKYWSFSTVLPHLFAVSIAHRRPTGAGRVPAWSSPSP